MTITTKSTKAEILAALKDAETRIATLEATQEKAVRIALRAGDNHGMCSVVEDTIKRAGLGQYLPPKYVIQVKGYYSPGRWGQYSAWRTLHAAKVALKEMPIDTEWWTSGKDARVVEIDRITRKQKVIATRTRKYQGQPVALREPSECDEPIVLTSPYPDAAMAPMRAIEFPISA